jgi:tRNA (mo5U34)-methyltransferase
VSDSQLYEAMNKLGPWKIDVEVVPGVHTAAFVERAEGTEASRFAVHPRDNFITNVTKVFPDGLAGRSFLDIGCDCGAYSFFAKEAGAGRVYAFDTDERGIEQARFLQEHRTVGPIDDMTFATHDAMAMDEQGVGEFDVTRFSRIFHRLRDPIAALDLAAKRTRELMIVNVATRSRAGDTEIPDGYLRQFARLTEGESSPRRLHWYPTGPNVLRRIVESCGFPETRVMFWSRRDDGSGIGQLEICGARSAETLAALDATRAAAAASPEDKA